MKRTIAWLAVAVVAAAVGVGIGMWTGGRTEKAAQPEESGGVDESGVATPVMQTEKGAGTSALVRHAERRPLEPEATKRLHDGPVVVSSVFEASGTAEHASGGKMVRGGYLYVTTVRARSEVVDKREDVETGRVLVVEKRKFLQARDELSLSDIDVALALSTLPLDQVGQWVDEACALVDYIAPYCGKHSETVSAVAETVKQYLPFAIGFMKSLDGTSTRAILRVFGKRGEKWQEQLEETAKERFREMAEGKLGGVKAALQSIEGKTYTITYQQAANGQPLKIDFAHDGGEPITPAEWEILRSANAFLDQNLVPDARCEVGDHWTVWADEAQEFFGLGGDGESEGRIRVTREEDLADGSWALSIEPAEIAFRRGDGTGGGTLTVQDGNGVVDAEKASVKTMQATGTGNLAMLDTTRHALFFDFVKRTEGNANLRFSLSVGPSEE
jgi:hypothetical protein